MKKQIVRLFFLAPMCLSIFSCSKQQQEQQESEKPFEQSMDATLVAEQDYIQHDGGQNHRWQYDQEMWYINNLDKVPLPDPQQMMVLLVDKSLVTTPLTLWILKQKRFLNQPALMADGKNLKMRLYMHQKCISLAINIISTIVR